MLPQSKILVFGAHPDDIEIGMAGTLSLLASCGQHQIIPIIGFVPNKKNIRILESKHSAKLLTIQPPLFLYQTLPTTFSQRKLVTKVDQMILKYRPHYVFCHSDCDSHQEHLAISNAVLSSHRLFSFELLYYETIIPGGIPKKPFTPNVYVDISKSIDKKVAALKTHRSQYQKYGDKWLDRIIHRALYHGGAINTKYAETFCLVRAKLSI